jgi:hypothetical protein
VAALLTCVVALYNAFPLTYPDTGNYVGNGADLLEGKTPWFFFRPLTYGMFLVPFATPYTFWLVPLGQGLLIAFVVDLALRAAAVPLSVRGFVLLFVGLSVFTSLPWFSGQVMPDIFTSIVILLCFVLVWGGERIERRDRWVALGLLAFAVATHLSHFPLAMLLLAGGVGARGLIDGRRLVALALGPAAALALSALVVVAPNYLLHDQVVLSRSSDLFALARLVGDSLAQPYLERACATERYRLCRDRQSLRPDVDWFLWKADGPRMRYEAELQRGDSTFLREAGLIVRGTLREELPAVVGSSARKAVKQTVTFGVAPGEHSYSPTVEATMTRLGPGIRRAYLRSRQARDAMPVVLPTWTQYAAVVLGLVVVVGCQAMSWGRGRRPVQILIATVSVGILLNAMVLASLARVHPRYQSRVIWLVPLVAVAAAVDLLRATGRRDRPANAA